MKTVFQCAPGYEAALRAAGLLDFDFLMKVKGGPASSSHAQRETVPLEIGIDGRPVKFYLKRVFKVPPKHAIAPLFRRRPNWSQPRQEWEVLGALAKRTIPAMKRVAFGERRRLGIPVQALLLVEAVSMPFTLENWLVPGFPRPHALDARDRHRLIYEFGRLIGRLHEQGFCWPDLHPKHVFAEPPARNNNPDHWRFCLIDVERMYRPATGSPLDEAVVRDFKRLQRNAAPFALTAFKIQLFAAGYAGRDGLTNRRTTAGKHDRYPRPEPMPLLPDDYEHPRAVPLERRKRMIVDARVEPFLSRLGWKTIADVFAYQRGSDLRKPGLDSHRERIRIQFPEGNGSASAYYLKRYDHPPFAEQFRRIREFRPTYSSAAREMHFIKRLAQIGVPSLRSIAFGQEMTGIWERRSFGLTAELDGQSLEKLVEQWRLNPKSMPDSNERHDLIRQLGLLVRLLHENDLFHRDLYLSHVFLTRNSDGRPVLRLIDLARMIEKPWNPRRWAIKDLAALAFSAPSPFVTRVDRFRFLYHYLGDRSESEGKRTVRRWLDDVSSKAARMARHDQRRTARLAGKALA